ncbi:cysteine desulfurase [Patescibacteria group bacterium]|nr:cysteine desulfurase [Patescibacteria group bacterium]MCL5797285.1 cysteine desulfurase [Patescibacteria group bacterium]
MFDLKKVKKDFPIFDRLINGKRIVYLDSTASTLKPRKVISALNDYYTRYSVNIFRGLYTLSEEATAEYEKARQKIARFIGCGNPKEVIFVRNATEGVNLVAQAWGEINIGKGEEIVSTVMEHHANIVPWQELVKKKGAVLKFVDFDNEGYLDLNDLEKKINRKTKLFAVTYMSNVLGTINPVSRIIKTVRRINPQAKILIDAAQAVPHLKVDVDNLGCDFLVFSGHKMLGPTGIGVVWGKYELLDGMFPYQFGGDMIKEVYLDKTVYKEPPHKFEAGTPHIAGAIGLGAAVDYLFELGMDNVRLHEIKLTEYGLRSLKGIDGLTVYGPQKAQERGGVLAFNLKKVHPHDAAQVLNEDNVCIRSGHHCAMPVHTKLHIPASCRASLYIYNTEEDIDQLVLSLQKAVKIFT